MAKLVSCGVVVTDGDRVLLGHATRSPRWDIPKGVAEPDESFVAAAVRELFEETGLRVAAAELRDLGVHGYLRDKDLALFRWMPATMPAVDQLICRSTFAGPGGALLPEFDRFALEEWDVAIGKVGRNMARVLAEVREAGGFRGAHATVRS